MNAVRQRNWKVGDRVCFAHDLKQIYRVQYVCGGEGLDIELDGMVGQFAWHLFVEPPTPSNAEEKQEDSAADSIDLPSATRKLAGWIEHSLGEHSLHVAIPVDVAKFIHGVLLGVQSRIAEKKKPYSTPELKGPFSHAELEILKAEGARAEPPVKDLAEKILSMIGLADSGRCMACAWPLMTDASLGCVLGSCSYRPGQHSPEYAIWRERTRILESVRKRRGG